MNIKRSSRYLDGKSIVHGLGPPHTGIETGGIVKLNRYRESTPNPKYKQIIKDEGNATTPLYAYEQYATQKQGNYFISYTDGITRTDTWGGTDLYATDPSELGLFFNANPNFRDTAVAKATASTYKAIADYQSLFQGQVFAAELREVIDLVKNPFAKSAKLTDSFLRTFSLDGANIRSARQWGTKAKRVKRNLARNAPRIPKAAADQWLEYQFAVSPLIADVAKLLSLAGDLAAKREHETVRGYGEAITVETIVQPTSGGGGYGWNCDRTVLTKYRIQNIIRAGMTAKFLDEIEKMNSSSVWLDQLDDFSSLPLTAWEVTPFSFLFDYFVNVQGLIQSATVSQRGISYVSNSIVRTKETTVRNGTAITISRPDWIQNVYPVISKEIVTGVRDVDRTATLLGIPPVVFSLPGSNIRYANIAALLTKLL